MEDPSLCLSGKWQMLPDLKHAGEKLAREQEEFGLKVIADHGNGIVDLGRDETVFVAKCQISKEPVTY